MRTSSQDILVAALHVVDAGLPLFHAADVLAQAREPGGLLLFFGVFGLGFFCYIVGSGLDQTFFPEHLPNPTYGKGGVLWASLTLALLTLPPTRVLRPRGAG